MYYVLCNGKTDSSGPSLIDFDYRDDPIFDLIKYDGENIS